MEESKEVDEVINEPISAIDKANLAAERMENANKEKERLLKIEEKLLIERKLSGTTEAGTPAAAKKEETAKEYSDRIMKGG